jgi:calcineurin-like phosphoesterase family protein
MNKTDLILSKYIFNIHGHLHEKESPNAELYENVSVEHTNYYPIKLDSILGKHKLHLKRQNKQGD